MIYFLRHGETVWNVQRRLQGQRDSPLTLAGIAQARANGALLGELIEAPDEFTVIASPLARTWQTATIVCETLGLDARSIRFEPRLKEHHFGDWEGFTLDEVETRFPDEWAARQVDKWNYRVPGGESYALVEARARSWLGEQNGESRLIVIGHGLAGRVLRGAYSGLPHEDIMSRFEPHGRVYRFAGGVVEEFSVSAD